MTLPPGEEARDPQPSHPLSRSPDVAASETRRESTPTIDDRDRSEATCLIHQDGAAEAVEEEDDFRSAENGHGAVAAGDAREGEVVEVTGGPQYFSKASEVEPDVSSLASAPASVLPITLVAPPTGSGGFTIRAAPLMVRAGLHLPPGEQVGDGQPKGARSAKVHPAAGAAGPQSMKSHDLEVGSTPRDQSYASDASPPANYGDQGSDDDDDGDNAATGNAEHIRREPRRPARLMEITEGPQLATKDSSRDYGKESDEAGGAASADRSDDVGRSGGYALYGGGSRVVARGGAPRGPTVESAEEKMRPHKKLASIYARAPRIDRPESSVCSADEMCGPDAIAEAAAAGLLAVAAGKEAPSRKRKATHATRVSKGDGAEAMAARNNRSFDTPRVERPFKVGNYTKSNSAQMVQIEAERAAVMARRDVEVQAKGQRATMASGGGVHWRGGALQSHWMRPPQAQPQNREMYGRQSYDNSLYGASGRIGGAGIQPPPQLGRGLGLAAQLKQSSVGEIVSKFYKYTPPAQPARMNDVRQAPVELNALHSFRNQSRGWDPPAYHQVAAPVSSFTPQYVARLVEQNRERAAATAAAAAAAATAAAADGDDGPEVVDEGNNADIMAMRHWEKNMALHRLAGNNVPHGGPFIASASEHGRFWPPPTKEAYETIVQRNQYQLSKLSDTMERLRRVVSSITEPVPAQLRMVIISRAQRLLEEICQSAPQIAPSEHAPLAAAVMEVQSWVQRQLRERMDEILVSKPMHKAGQQQKEISTKLRHDKGKDPAACDNRLRVKKTMPPPSNTGPPGVGADAGVGALVHDKVHTNSAPSPYNPAHVGPIPRAPLAPEPSVTAIHTPPPPDGTRQSADVTRVVAEPEDNAATGPPCNEEDVETEDAVHSTDGYVDGASTLTGAAVGLGDRDNERVRVREPPKTQEGATAVGAVELLPASRSVGG